MIGIRSKVGFGFSCGSGRVEEEKRSGGCGKTGVLLLQGTCVKGLSRHAGSGV